MKYRKSLQSLRHKNNVRELKEKCGIKSVTTFHVSFILFEIFNYFHVVKICEN